MSSTAATGGNRCQKPWPQGQGRLQGKEEEAEGHRHRQTGKKMRRIWYVDRSSCQVLIKDRF